VRSLAQSQDLSLHALELDLQPKTKQISQVCRLQKVVLWALCFKVLPMFKSGEIMLTYLLGPSACVTAATAAAQAGAALI